MALPGLHWRIALAMGLGVLLGSWLQQGSGPLAMPLAVLLDFIGTLFTSALKMVMLPLVISALIVGVASAGSGRRLGRLGLRTVTFFLLTTIAAIITGMVLANLLMPGIVDGRPASDVLALEASSADMPGELADKGLGDVFNVLVGIVPGNVFSAAASDDMIGVIVFSILFGSFMLRIRQELAATLSRFWSGVHQVMLGITGWIMRFAPLGAFCLAAQASAKSGLAAAAPLLAFSGVVLAALAAHALLTLPLLLRLFAGTGPLAFYRAMMPAVLTGLATASSPVTLPVTMQCAVERAAIPNRVASLALPLGAAINLNGTALYQAVAAVFLAQAYGIDLSLWMQFVILAIAVAASVATPGVPYGSLVAISVILSTIGLPTEAVGVLLVVDRLLEMARTSVDVLGDAVCAAIIARHDDGLVADPSLAEAASG